MRTYRAGFAVMMVALLLLAACGGSTPSLGGGDGNAQAVLCQSVTAVRSAAAQLSDINPDTKLSEIKDTKAKVDKLVDALRAANGVLQRPSINDLIAKYDSFSAELSAVDTQETLGPAVEKLRQNIGAVNTALDQAKSTLGCQ